MLTERHFPTATVRTTYLPSEREVVENGREHEQHRTQEEQAEVESIELLNTPRPTSATHDGLARFSLAGERTYLGGDGEGEENSAGCSRPEECYEEDWHKPIPLSTFPTHKPDTPKAQ